MTSHAASVRSARVDDLPDLVRLATLAHEHMAALRGGPVFLASDARPFPPDVSLRADLDRDDAMVLVGCLGRTSVGYTVARVRDVTDTRLAVVTDLFVEADGRRVGVGAALLAAVVAWAGEQACSGIDTMVLPGDRNTKNFFEGFGMVARAITVHRSIDGATGSR